MHSRQARRLSRALRRVAVGSSVVVMLVATGCANDSPGVVAYVGDSSISQKQLDDALAGIEQTLEAGQQVSTPAVVNVMIHGVLAEQIAAAHHLQITDAQRDQLIGQTNLGGLLAIPTAKPVAYDVADEEIVSQALGSAVYVAEAAQRKVTLNPRFGVLDPKQQTVVDNSSGSLSTPLTPASQPAG
jgi:hypothetical protein